ncbi:MAG: tetratricopeptide repeat protein [Promethearchaeota archaeon]|nr:MAG: tetratricopeptide repeat protein [Candidatus Lokiarchaeota archaeon]
MTENETEFNKEELQQLLNEKLENLKELDKVGKNSNYIQELSDIALIQLQLEQFIESEETYLICLKHFRKQKDRLGQAAVYGLLGTLNFKKGEYEKSIDFYEKAYNIYNELHQIQEKITCLKGIGNSYIQLNQWDDACDIFLDCSALCSDNNDIYNLLDCLGNLIHIHETVEKWDIVFELYKKTLKIFKEIKDNKGIITSYFNLGILQKKFNNLEDAVRYFKKGTNMAIDSNFADLIIRGFSYIGENLFYLGKIKEAKNQFIKALHIAKKIGADNAVAQLRILLESIGMQNKNILDELKEYEKSQK